MGVCWCLKFKRGCEYWLSSSLEKDPHIGYSIYFHEFSIRINILNSMFDYFPNIIILMLLEMNEIIYFFTFETQNRE